MKILAFLILAIPALCQDHYIKVNEIKSVYIENGKVQYDTLPKGVGVAYKFLVTYPGLRDTTKQIVVKYETFQIDAVQKIDTIDSELLVYTDWTKHGPISDPIKVPGWYKNTISYSTTGEAKFTFNGTGVEIWAEKLPSHGTGSVTVGTQTKKGFWNGSDVNGDGVIQESEKVTEKQLPAKIAEFKGLPQGQHTVTIKPISGVVLLDFLVITR